MSRRVTARLRRPVWLLLLWLPGCRRAALDVPALVRGNLEVALAPDGGVIPQFQDTGAIVGLCLEIPDNRDTSAWKGVLTFDGRESPAGLAPPAARLGRTLCFESAMPVDMRPSPAIQLCGRVVDGYDRSERRLPCRRIVFDPGRAEVRKRILESQSALLARTRGGDTAAMIEGLDALAREAAQHKLHAVYVSLQLIAAHFLTRERTPQALQEARRRLDELPAWVDRPEAGWMGALVALQRADFYLESGPDYGRAWRLLSEAEGNFLRLARGERFTVTVKQAAILSRLGATRDAYLRLRASLAECERMRCRQDLLVGARSDLAWLVSLDPDASANELAEARAGIEAARASLPARSFPLEHALQIVNLVYLEMRQGKDPTPLLREARTLLRAVIASPSQARLLDWLDLFEGLHALDTGAAARAVALCAPLGSHADPTLAAWALSCAGQAERQRGDLRKADGLFERALERHEFRHLASDQSALFAPGRGAEDLMWAVRTAVELKEPGRAWELLRHMDGLARHERQRLECRASAQAETRDEWQRIDAEAQQLYGQLVASSRPASQARQRSLEPIRHDLKARLRELWRTWPGCAAMPEADDAGVRFRAVALADEILLLERDAAGEVKLARRTSLSRNRLRSLTDRIAAAMADGRMARPQWAALTAPLAEALLPPESETLGPVTAYTLHGLLQRIPLAALPLGGPRAGRFWLGQATAVAVQPAAAARVAGSRSTSQDRPVFIVDPVGDLAGASELLPVYARLFPDARILHGRAATSSAFRRSLGGAAWLHLDGHGMYDAAFPELSAVVLADRPVSLMELADLPVPRRFANLSACRSGEGPTTPDGGRYGIAGLLVRRGVPWVVASITDLDDEVARDFNRAFYHRLSRNVSIPEAYRGALEELDARHPPAAWAPLLLLAGAGFEEEGGSPLPARLLSSIETQVVATGQGPGEAKRGGMTRETH